MNLVDYEKYYHSGSEFIIPRDEFEKIIEENQRLNNVLNGIDKILIEHIDECREELNTIYKTEDSEYINQCSKEFDVIRKNIEMIINKVNELKESDK